MDKMNVAIQCRDDRTGELGSFGFRTGRNTNRGIRFYSLTPVFNSLTELYPYMKENGIEPVHGPFDTGIISM